MPMPLAAVARNTSSDSVFVVMPFALSATCTAKVNKPAAVGVPLKTPALLKVSPPGRPPLFKVHVYGAVPLEAENVCE